MVVLEICFKFMAVPKTYTNLPVIIDNFKKSHIYHLTKTKLQEVFVKKIKTKSGSQKANYIHSDSK